MWRSVFLHEFLDHRIGNLQAMPGRLTPASLALRPDADALPGVNAVRIGRGRALEYTLAAPLRQVIGMSLRVRLAYPLTNQAHLFPIAGLGPAAEVLLFPQTHPTPDLQGTLANVLVRLGNAHLNFGLVTLPAHTFTDLRFDWHVSGQARVSADGKLIAYTNAATPGAAYDVERLVVGAPLEPVAPPPYVVSRVFVRVLLRADALARFSQLLPPVQLDAGDPDRCRRRITFNLLKVVERLRTFMTGVHQVLSQPWTEAFGPADGPFRREAVQAHALATAAGAALATMLRTGDVSAPERFLDPFTGFLRIVRAARPAEFTALLAELDAMTIVPDACRAALAADAARNADALAAVVGLLEAAMQRLRLVAGEA
jgi:hypothetical protein